MALNRSLACVELAAALELGLGGWREVPHGLASAADDIATAAEGSDAQAVSRRSADAGDAWPGLATEVEPPRPLRICDAFAASGALALRWALEVGCDTPAALAVGRPPLHVTAGDMDGRCVDLIATNAALNGVDCERLCACLTPVGAPGPSAAPVAEPAIGDSLPPRPGTGGNEQAPH